MSKQSQYRMPDPDFQQSNTEYNFDTNYISRHIIGLPSEVEMQGYDQITNALGLVSRVTYAYDEGNFSDSGLSQSISPVQHDNTNYGSSFAYRGNLTSVTRWDATLPTTSAASVTSSMKYNTAGSVVSKTSPWDGTNTRTIRIGYSDNFNFSPGVTTYAYPTVMTDPAGTSLGESGHSSTVKYRYDMGANVEAESPAPTGQTYGKKSKRIYDSIGRLERNSVYVNTTEQSYARYEFPANGIQSKVFTTIVDTNNNNAADTADEVYSESWSDGAGRTRMSRTEHPGSTGGWASTITEYDILGRVYRQSIPTETNSSYAPAGDDATRGFLWTYQKYDWKGRVIRKINTDGVDSPTLNDSDTLISYEGCGCAGGQVTTIQGENVPRDDTSGNARRTQKVYEDILGRQWKTVLYEWDGTTAYTTTEQFFNGRDQIVKTKQTDNTSTATPQTYQEVLTTFDGHGRAKTRHYPIEDASTNTTWNYNPDDSVSQVIDPRGVVTDITYNNVGLTTQIAYTPTGTIPDTPTVTFGYDNLGNRTSMDTAGVSETTYAYDSLSQMTSETVDFDDLSSNYTIGYSYQLSGKLKSVTDPFSAVVNYNDDKLGRTNSITGSGFSNVSTYASQIKYRAWGSLKEMQLGSADNSVVSYTFDDALRPVGYQSTSNIRGSGFVRHAEYEYFADGKPKKAGNLIESGNDQNYKYDFAGRLTANGFGTRLDTDENEVPTYSQWIGYDAFNQMKSRSTVIWGEDGDDFTATYLNGRKQSSNEVYDATGNIIEKPTADPDFYSKWKYDAGGALLESKRTWFFGGYQQTSYDMTETITQKRDGDGQLVVHDRVRDSDLVNPPGPTSSYEEKKYYLNSTVLGGVLTELDGQGGKKLTNVYNGGAVLAMQTVIPNYSEVAWKHQDVITGGYELLNKDGNLHSSLAPPTSGEFEPLGASIPQSDPFVSPDPDIAAIGHDFSYSGSVGQAEYGCMWNGAPIRCTMMNFIIGVYGPGTQIEVNTRAENGYQIQGLLDGNIRFRRRTTQTGISIDGSPMDYGDPVTHWDLISGAQGEWLEQQSSQQCLNAINAVAPSNLAAYASTAIAALDRATSGNGYTWPQFAYLLATTEHESQFGALMEEIWGPSADQKGYDPKFNRQGNVTNQKAKDLGNNQLGDGYRYRGRGYVQITGRGNYVRFSRIIPSFSAIDSNGATISSTDLEEYPTAAGFTDVAASIAAQGLQNDYFKQRGRSIGNVIGSGTFNEFLSARDFIGARYVRVRRGRRIIREDVGTKIANRALDYLAAIRGNCP